MTRPRWRQAVLAITLVATSACGDDAATSTSTSESTPASTGTTKPATSDSTTTTTAPEIEALLIAPPSGFDVVKRTEDLHLDDAATSLGTAVAEEPDTYLTGVREIWHGTAADGSRLSVSVNLLAFDSPAFPGAFHDAKTRAVQDDPTREAMNAGIDGVTVWQAVPDSGVRGGAAFAALGRIYVQVAVDGAHPAEVRNLMLTIVGEQMAALDSAG